MYTRHDLDRLVSIPKKKSDPRSEFRIDYARLVHSSSFRRLQGKTQLFPANENDYFRNRLTHSLEVSQVATSIALKLNKEHLSDKDQLDLDLVAFAALAHDLGHPPFGHQGEEALDEKMINYGGFEGNAQTLRLLKRIEKKYKPDGYPSVFTGPKDWRIGLNLTPRTIASILKYDFIIPENRKSREAYRKSKSQKKIQPVKGYYATEDVIVNYIKACIVKGKIPTKFKTIECQIMDISDDIAYSTYDLDDTLKSGFHRIYDLVFPKEELLEAVRKDLSDEYSEITTKEIGDVLLDIFSNAIALPRVNPAKLTEDNYDDFWKYVIRTNYQTSVLLAEDSFNRHHFTSSLVDQFVNGIQFDPKRKKAFSIVELMPGIRLKVEILKKFNFQLNILSPRLKVVAYRGKEVIDKIFDVLVDEKLRGYQLMPEDFQSLYLNAPSKKQKYRIVCDFIAGMTDRYCIEFYARLTSESPETIFKPF